MFSLRWFTYFFAGFMVISLLALITGVNITFWQSYTLEVGSGVQYSVDWYSIKRFDNSFWEMFRTLNNTYGTFIDTTNPIFAIFKNIPNIPMIPTFNTGGFMLVVDVLINFVNGISTLINVVINVVNSIRTIIITITSFTNALTIWITSAGSHIVPIIY